METPCAVDSGGQEPHVATKHLKRGDCNTATKVLPLIPWTNFLLSGKDPEANSRVCLVATKQTLQLQRPQLPPQYMI